MLVRSRNGPPLARPARGGNMMGWIKALLLVLLSMTVAGCELAGDIFEAGAWIGAIVVVLIIAIVGVVVAKIRG